MTKAAVARGIDVCTAAGNSAHVAATPAGPAAACANPVAARDRRSRSGAVAYHPAAMRDPEIPIAPAPWRASLALGYELRNGRTTLVERRHDGPLVVQKPLYPDTTGRCETVIVHPPGGIAGGDALAIAVDAGAGSELLLTTPGATRWYK